MMNCKLYTLIILLVSLAVRSEVIERLSGQGMFSLEASTRLGVVISTRIKKRNYSPEVDHVSLEINGEAVASFSEKRKRMSFAVWNYEPELLFERGEYKVYVRPSSDWVFNSDIKVVAWKATGRDMPPLIREYAGRLDIKIGVRDFANARYILDDAVKMKNLVLARSRMLNDYLEYLKRMYEEAGRSLNECQKRIAESEQMIAERQQEEVLCKAAIDRFQQQLDEANAELAVAVADENQAEINRLNGLIGSFKKSITDEVEKIEDTHQVIYYHEKLLEEYEVKERETVGFIQDAPALQTEAGDEIEKRTEDYNQLKQLIAKYEPMMQEHAQYNDNSGTTTIIEKNQKRSVSEIFGIACIPACAIAIPVGFAASVIYTEIRRPSDYESGYEDPEILETDPVESVGTVVEEQENIDELRERAKGDCAGANRISH